MKQKRMFCRDQGDKGFSYAKWKGRQLIHQWWNMKESSRKTESFLQIQLSPSWHLGSAHSPSAGTEIRVTSGLEQGSLLMGQLSWLFQGEVRLQPCEIRRGRGDSENSTDHHKRLSWSAATILWQDGRTAPAALSTAEGQAWEQELVPSKSSNRAAPSLLPTPSLPAWGQTGKFMKSLWSNPSFLQYLLEPPQFLSQLSQTFKWSGNETIKIIKMKIKNLRYHSGLKFSGLLSAYDSHTWRLWLVQTEGGIFKSTVDVTWILPKANSFQLTNNHCPANMPSWVIILPLYQEAAWVKKPWGILGLQTHVISLEMKATTKCFTNLYLFPCW